MSIIVMLNLQITDTFVIYPALVFLVSILFNMTDWLSSRFYEEGSTETSTMKDISSGQQKKTRQHHTAT